MFRGKSELIGRGVGTASSWNETGESGRYNAMAPGSGGRAGRIRPRNQSGRIQWVRVALGGLGEAYRQCQVGRSGRSSQGGSAGIQACTFFQVGRGVVPYGVSYDGIFLLPGKGLAQGDRAARRRAPSAWWAAGSMRWPTPTGTQQSEQIDQACDT